MKTRRIKSILYALLMPIWSGIAYLNVFAADDAQSAGSGASAFLKIASGLLTMIALGFSIYNGWLYAKSRREGDEEGETKAKKMLIIGVIAFSVFFVIFLLFGIFGPSGNSGPSANLGQNAVNEQINKSGRVSCDADKDTAECNADTSFCAEGEYCGADCTCQKQGGLGDACGNGRAGEICSGFQNDCSLYLSCSEDNYGGCYCFGGPVIKLISPQNETSAPFGSPGDLITIHGQYFGEATGTVYFSDSAGSQTVKAELASEQVADCQKSWQEKQIVVVVPISASSGPIKIVRSDNEIDLTNDERGPELKDFVLTTGLSRPGLCQLTPDRARIGDALILKGKNLGASSKGGVVFDGDTINAVSWAENKIETKVTEKAVSGFIRIKNNKNIFSNDLALAIGDCLTDSDCSGNEICCDSSTNWAGACRAQGSCNAGAPGESGFGWSFTTSPAKPKKCGGYNDSIDACLEVETCPNSPGQCRNSVEEVVGRGCGKEYCGYNYKACANGQCSYDQELNKCTVNETTCSVDNGEKLDNYNTQCRQVGGRAVWQYKPTVNYCAALSTFMDSNGWCTLGTVYQPKTCTLCPDGFSCEAGQCQSISSICPKGSSCNDNSQCIVDETAKITCECCCEVGVEQSCCSGLTCEPGNCGSGAPDYGLCSGCRKDGNGDKIATSSDPNDVAASNALCNCTPGSNNRYCDMDDSRYPTGVCRDMAEVGEDCRGIGDGVCNNKGFSLCTPETFCSSANDCVCQSKAKAGEKCCDPASSECGGDYIPCDDGLICSAKNGYICISGSKGVCGNGIIEPGETCEISNWGKITGCGQLGDFSNGRLMCGYDCQFITGQCKQDDPGENGYCGDGIVQRGEECDGSNWGGTIKGCLDFDKFTGGTLRCDSNCLFNTTQCTGGTKGVCGDKTVNTGETCDGNDWGDKITSCKDFDDFTGGVLSCDPYCHFSTSLCQKKAGNSCDPITDPCPFGQNCENGVCVEPGYCGDNNIQRGEQCDGDDWGFIKDCTDIGDFSGGDLLCGNNCLFDTNQCERNNPPSPGGGERCQKENVCTIGVSQCAYDYQCLTAYDNTDCRCCCDPDSGIKNSSGLSCYANKEPCGGAERGLYCGCTSDDQCDGSQDNGCGTDTCCHARPQVAAVTPADNEIGVCRNVEVQVEFDQKMNIASFNKNIKVISDYGDGICPAGTEQVAIRDSNSIFYAKSDQSAGWIRKALAFLGISRPAAASGSNYCAVNGRVSGVQSADGKSSILKFTPTNGFDSRRVYNVVLLGEGGDQSSGGGIQSYWGVGLYNQGIEFTMNDIVYNAAFVSSFTTLSDNGSTKGYCLINKIYVTPESYLFQTANNSAIEDDTLRDGLSFDTVADSDKLFVAMALNDKNQSLASTDAYGWKWNWGIDDPDVAGFRDVTVGLADNERLIGSLPDIVDARAEVNIQAIITKSVIPGLAPVGQIINGQADVWVFICDNPWPAVKNGLWSPWTDRPDNCTFGTGTCLDTGFEIYYCRDYAGVGTADDLPAIYSSNAVIRTQSSLENLLKEFYFFREKIPGKIVDFSVTDKGTSGAVEASWSPVNGAVAYKLYYGEESLTYDNFIETTTLNQPVSGLVNGRTYFFALTSVSSSHAESEYSEEVAVTPSDKLPPPAPVISALETGNASVKVKWNKVTEETVPYYKILYGFRSGSYGQELTVSSNNNKSSELEYTISKLTNGQTYYFALVAVDMSGNESARSAEESAVPGTD